VFNSNIKINVDLSHNKKPRLDWFFYNEGMEDVVKNDFLEGTTYPEFEESNVSSRGMLFDFTLIDDSTEVDSSDFKKTYAVPLIMKIEEDDNNNITNNYNMTFDFDPEVYLPTGDNIMTYWSGFASNKGSGCEDIADGEDTLVFNYPDLIETKDGLKHKVSLPIYNTIKENGVEYLQTVLYSPYNERTGTNEFTIQIDSNAELYSLQNACENGECDINGAITDYKINSLREIFDGIIDEKICVAPRRQGNETNWKIFWNEQKILGELEDIKKILDEDEVKRCGNK
jgi:hypothetical protein